MKSLAHDASDILIHAAGCAAAQPTAHRQSDSMIIVPYDHAVAHNGMDVHGVEEGDLGDVQRHLRILDRVGTEQPRKKALCQDSLVWGGSVRGSLQKDGRKGC